MESGNQDYAKNKKDTYSLKMVMATLLLVVLFLGELYFMINDPKNYIALIILTVVTLADIYVLIASSIQRTYQKDRDRYEQYDNLFKSEKASYLIIRKSFEDVLDRLDRIEAASGIPTEEIINAQKSIAKVTISRNKENSDALMNSNDKMYERLFSLEDAIEMNNAALLEKQKIIVENANKDLIMKQQEIISKLREAELSIKNEVLSSMTRSGVVIPQPAASQPEPVYTERTPDVMTQAEEPVMNITEEPEMNLEHADFDLDPEETAERKMGIAEETEEPIMDSEEEPLGLGEDFDSDFNLGFEEEEILTEKAEEEMEEPSEPEEPAAPVDPNHIMTPDEIAALIAGTNEVEEPILDMDVSLEETTEEPEAEAPPIDPNRMMTPDEIAALFANA